MMPSPRTTFLIYSFTAMVSFISYGLLYVMLFNAYKISYVCIFTGLILFLTFESERRNFGRQQFRNILLVLANTLGIFFCALLNDGLKSPILYWLVVVYLICVFVGKEKIRELILFCSSVIFTGFIFLIFYKVSPEVPHDNIIVQLGAFIGVFSFAIFYALDSEKRNKELKLAKEKLEKSNSTVIQKEKLAAIGLLTSGIGHQIGNILNGLSASTFRIKYMKIEDEKKKAELDEIYQGMKFSIVSCKHVIQSMSNVTKLGNEVKSENVSELVDSAIILTKGKALERVNIDHRMDSSIHARCNKSGIIQALMNLISNSIDAVLENKGSISIHYDVSDEEVYIFVADNGPGIPPEILPKIFEAFETSKGSDKGTGLGLFVAKQEVEKSGGTIELLESNKGTIFKITLKRA